MSNNKKELIINKLVETRQELLALLHGLEERQWETVVYAEGSNWTVIDLLRHLVDGERGMTRLMMQIQAGGEGTPPDFDLSRWNERVIQKAKEKTADQLIAELEENRLVLFNFINTLEEEDWSKQGRHASLRIMSIEQICHLISDHEKSHIGDIQKSVEE